MLESFEALTIDGDTSPNDSSLLVASGNKENFIKKNSKDEKRLEKAIKEIFEDETMTILYHESIILYILRTKNVWGMASAYSTRTSGVRVRVEHV